MQKNVRIFPVYTKKKVCYDYTDCIERVEKRILCRKI